MKKIFMIFAMMFMAVFANAQVDTVIVNGNGTYTQYIDTLTIPVDSTMSIDTIGHVFDTTMVIDTVNSDTNYVVDTIAVLDTNYALYDTVYYDVFTAIPDSGWVFVNWVVAFTYDSVDYTDTSFTETVCIDWFDTNISLTLNFDSVENVGIATLNNIDVKVYPNPTTGIINIDGDFDYVKIYDMDGKPLYHGSYSCLDLQYLPKGSYFFVIVKNNVAKTIPVIKQ